MLLIVDRCKASSMASSDKRHHGDKYHIELPDSEDWRLTDFYLFPHAYEQCYAFIYCLETDLPSLDRQRIDYAFGSYPWRGGYSYVNIYNVMAAQLPAEARPRVISIHKASPGWLDLALNIEAATNLAKALAIMAGAGVSLTAAYSQGMKIISGIKTHRERARLQRMRLTIQQTKAIKSNCEEMAKALGFKTLADLHKRTGDPEVSLKLLLAHARRMKQLNEYIENGKVVMPIESDKR